MHALREKHFRACMNAPSKYFRMCSEQRVYLLLFLLSAYRCGQGQGQEPQLLPEQCKSTCEMGMGEGYRYTLHRPLHTHNLLWIGMP